MLLPPFPPEDNQCRATSIAGSIFRGIFYVMTDPTTAYDRSGVAAYRAEVFLPFDRSRSVGGWVEASATALVVTAGGERLELAPGSTAIALGGHNGERVVVEGDVAAGSPRAGERVYLQCPDLSLLAHLATHGPPELRTNAARVYRV